MKRKVLFEQEALEGLDFWNKKDPKMASKVLGLIKETARTPFEGTGKPEPLNYIIKN